MMHLWSAGVMWREGGCGGSQWRKGGCGACVEEYVHVVWE